MKVRMAVLTAILMIVACSGMAADWPQWQGINRDAKSPDTGLLKQWPQNGPPLAWRIDKLGGGDGGPAIAGGRIYLMSNRGDQEVVIALSEKDGSEIWVSPLGPAFRQQASQGREGPSCTPTVDGDRLYVVGLAGNVACLQTSDGKIVWQKSLADDFGGRRPMWSFRESPLVDGDKVIVTPGGTDAMLVALNKLTSETIWKSKMPDAPAAAAPAPGGAGGPGEGRGGPDGPRGPGEGRGGRGGRGGGFGGGGGGASYASAIAIDFEGQRQIVQLTASALIGVAAADGKFLWRYDKPANRMGINCSTAVHSDGMIFASSAYGAGGGLVKLSKDASGAIKAEEVYATTDMQNHHGGMILLDGYLYGATGGNEGGALACMEFKTGKILWDLRKDGQRRAKGSLTYADGLLYYRMEDGVVVLVEPKPDKYAEVSRFEQPDRSKLPAWAHPVIANGNLYIRDQDILFCYDVKAK
ncbi:MAG: PQQ-binding-like beta-propeller repeat protein [Phycisphaerae bacterium]|nr:PQQ-binding-like beta-propeller repeat protein [Phycisphaerae bacterium]